MSLRPLLILLCITGSALGAGKERLVAALMAGEGAGLSVTWDMLGARGLRLSVASGKAQLASCPQGECLPPHATLVLTPGQRERLLSALRGSNLHQLRSEGPADRRLKVQLGAESGAWSVPRAAWPVPPAGGGLADFLDELADDLESRAKARPTLPVPGTLADLAQVQLTFTLKPRTGPGGTVVVSKGRATITPAEGTVPRAQRLAPSQRALSSEEQDRLLRGLAGLSGLTEKVPQRAAPAVGDTDGRLVSIYLAPQDDLPQLGRPFGLVRFLADLQRSPAAPLCEQMLGLMGAGHGAK